MIWGYIPFNRSSSSLVFTAHNLSSFLTLLVYVTVSETTNSLSKIPHKYSFLDMDAPCRVRTYVPPRGGAVVLPVELKAQLYVVFSS